MGGSWAAVWATPWVLWLIAPLVLAIVLGDRAESSFRQAMLVSQGDMTVFFSNALVGSLTGLALFLLFWPLAAWALGRLRRS